MTNPVIGQGLYSISPLRKYGRVTNPVIGQGLYSISPLRKCGRVTNPQSSDRVYTDPNPEHITSQFEPLTRGYALLMKVTFFIDSVGSILPFFDNRDQFIFLSRLSTSYN